MLSNTMTHFVAPPDGLERDDAAERPNWRAEWGGMTTR